MLLATSAAAFTVMKYIGAAYVYLGARLWRAPACRFDPASTTDASLGRRFVEGLSLQLTNPKAILFFLSVFPQFLESSRPGGPQFALLVLTYGLLVVLIHSGYALTARRAKGWLPRSAGERW